MHRIDSDDYELPAVLLVAGQTCLSSGLVDALSLGGCAVQCVGSDQPIQELAESAALDVVVFARLEPADLVRYCESARDLPCRPALLVISSHPQQQTQAFRAGADDCIAETSDTSALVERVIMNALKVRSIRSRCASQRVIRTPAGTLAVTLGPLVALDGIPLDLPRVQIRLLRALMEASRPVSVGELASNVWPRELVAVHTVHTQVALLRSRLENLGIKIDHIRRTGYVLSLLQQKEA